MAWQDELISSPEEAMHFIRRHLTAPNMPHMYVYDLMENFESEFSICASSIDADVDDDDPRSKDIKDFLNFSVMDGPGTACTAKSFRVDEDFRKNGFGSLGVKALLGTAYSFSPQAIYCQHVWENGISFWPYMGALPLSEPVGFADHIRNYCKNAQIAPVIAEKLGSIAAIAEQSPYLGWRLLGIAKSIPHEIRHAIFEPLCDRKDLILLPGEPSTRKLLTKRLGVLPPFRAPDADNDYRRITQALSGSEATALRLALG